MSTDPNAPADDAGGHEDVGAPPDVKMPLTRAAALWTALIMGFLVLIVLLVFITQNLGQVTLNFLSWHGTLPLGVAILLAAIGGGLLTVLVGTVRIYQLRRTAKQTLALRR